MCKSKNVLRIHTKRGIQRLTERNYGTTVRSKNVLNVDHSIWKRSKYSYNLSSRSRSAPESRKIHTTNGNCNGVNAEYIFHVSESNTQLDSVSLLGFGFGWAQVSVLALFRFEIPPTRHALRSTFLMRT